MAVMFGLDFFCIIWIRFLLFILLSFNPLDSKGNYSATSSNTSWYTGR